MTIMVDGTECTTWYLLKVGPHSLGGTGDGGLLAVVQLLVLFFGGGNKLQDTASPG